MQDMIPYIATAGIAFAIGALARGLVAAAEMKAHLDKMELAAHLQRQQQHKNFMDLVDTIDDYKIQVSAASLYLTHGQQAAYAFIIDELQKPKE